MKRFGLLVLLLFTAGCRTVQTSGPSGIGASSSELAVMEFLSAARSQDLQAMSAIWGDADGLTREREDRVNLERRLLIINCHLRHDESRIGAGQSGEGGRIMHSVELVSGTTRASTLFTTVRNRRSGNWVVENLDIRPLAELCNTSQSGSRRD